MKSTNKKGEVNVYIVHKNYIGEITDETLIATFSHANWAMAFLKAICATDFNNEYNYYDMRVN